MKHRHTNQAYSLSFLARCALAETSCSSGLAKGCLPLTGFGKTVVCCSAPQETERMARNRRSLLQESRSQPTPETSGRLRKKIPSAAAKVKQGKQRTDYSVLGFMGTFSPASFLCAHSLCPRPPWYHLVTEANTGNQTLGVINLLSSFSSLFYRQEFSERHVRNEEHIPVWGLNTTFPWIQEFVLFFFCILDIRTIVICKAREYYYSSFPFCRGIICIFCKTLPPFEVCTEKSRTKC